MQKNRSLSSSLRSCGTAIFFITLDTTNVIHLASSEPNLSFVEKRQQKKELLAPAGKVYDPEKQYVVNREKVGRPRRVLSDEEQANIRRLRGQGMSINAIAKELGINNRRVMEYCKNS